MIKSSLFCITFFLCSSLLLGQDIIYFDKSNPPFMYQNGEAVGLYPSIVKEIYRRLNQNVVCVSVPWIRALTEVKKSPVGIGGLYKNSEREQFLDFTIPLYQEKLVIYYLKTTKIKINTLQDLYGKKVGVIRGWSYGDYFDSTVKNGNFITEETTSDILNMKKLINKRLDVVIAIVNSGDKAVSKVDIGNQIQKSDPILYLDVYIAYNKKINKQLL